MGIKLHFRFRFKTENRKTEKCLPVNWNRESAGETRRKAVCVVVRQMIGCIIILYSNISYKLMAWTTASARYNLVLLISNYFSHCVVNVVNGGTVCFG